MCVNILTYDLYYLRLWTWNYGWTIPGATKILHSLGCPPTIAVSIYSSSWCSTPTHGACSSGFFEWQKWYTSKTLWSTCWNICSVMDSILVSMEQLIQHHCPNLFLNTSVAYRRLEPQPIEGSRISARSWQSWLWLLCSSPGRTNVRVCSE